MPRDIKINPVDHSFIDAMKNLTDDGYIKKTKNSRGVQFEHATKNSRGKISIRELRQKIITISNYVRDNPTQLTTDDLKLLQDGVAKILTRTKKINHERNSHWFKDLAYTVKSIFHRVNYVDLERSLETVNRELLHAQLEKRPDTTLTANPAGDPAKAESELNGVAAEPTEDGAKTESEPTPLTLLEIAKKELAELPAWQNTADAPASSLNFEDDPNVNKPMYKHAKMGFEAAVVRYRDNLLTNVNKFILTDDELKDDIQNSIANPNYKHNIELLSLAKIKTDPAFNFLYRSTVEKKTLTPKTIDKLILTNFSNLVKQNVDDFTEKLKSEQTEINEKRKALTKDIKSLGQSHYDLVTSIEKSKTMAKTDLRVYKNGFINYLNTLVRDESSQDLNLTQHEIDQIIIDTTRNANSLDLAVRKKLLEKIKAHPRVMKERIIETMKTKFDVKTIDNLISDNIEQLTTVNLKMAYERARRLKI